MRPTTPIPSFWRCTAKGSRPSIPTERTEIAHEMQTIYHDNSGYIIPCFSPTIDGHSASVQGVQPSKIGLPFNNFDLKSLWLSS